MKNIILVGMMSSGKTTLGKKLARALNYQFVDLDKLIEKDQGIEISFIFKQRGEAYFREVESRMLKKLLLKRHCCWLRVAAHPAFDNMEMIRQMGISIFLDVPAEDLVKGLKITEKMIALSFRATSSLVETLGPHCRSPPLLTSRPHIKGRNRCQSSAGSPETTFTNKKTCQKQVFCFVLNFSKS